MKKASKLSTLLLGFLFCIPLSGQSHLAPCATNMGVSPWLRDFQSRINETPRNDDTLYIPMQIHVVGKDDGSGYMSRNAVFNAFCTLNADFEQTNIRFYMSAPINYIDNDTYYEHNFNQGFSMMQIHNLPNTINCYIVESAAGACGYYSPGVDGIALAKSCNKPSDHTWAHEVGHFLSLPHPFSGWEGVDDFDYSTPAPNAWGNRQVERLDGSNCTFAGDGFCDTPPDYLSERWTCNINGVSGVTQTDPSGGTFVSEGRFFMSYANDPCMDSFSDDQIAAMRANIEEVRPGLLSPLPNFDEFVIETPEDISVLSPAEGVIIETPSVTLEWEPIPGATHYILQINPFSIFSIVFEEQYVEGTSAVVTNLDEDETYYWRLRPVNEYETCTEFTDPASFSTGMIVSTNELSENEVFELFPNPVSNGALQLNIRLSQNSAMSWRLMDATGSILQQDDLGTVTSLRRIALPVADLPAGIYFVQVHTTDRQLVRKVLIK